ncbi:MAG: ATP-binding cassette domain-containing protein [Rhodospirillaceae bacterium]|nr:ATP-binding cassette domain-containing protein [Rhodospirillaceae bacterium]MBT3926554.1 ATP-binding cassette domain-containing protein [Rhodospirillaceae bacterium]MBT5677382.1 ATP-binding cassette domain-containing protein [Rhodospirillaceae bacterium]MBT5780978.1 ATP-binding cassette domain-containing protein [Rhodospirillaceae bacterium]
MDKNIYKFIFKHTKGQQIYILLVTICSMPFYYASLDIPKLIINSALKVDDPAIQGDEFPRPLTILGIEIMDVSQLTLLGSLCVIFLFLVLVNGGFKMYINIYKGRMGERMLRRLRYLLYSRILRFPLSHFRKVSQGELIPMITAEVEPLGGFIGDAFAVPALQGGLLMTAIFYIFSQDPLMGIASILLYPIQGYIIPKLQKKVNLLGKARVREVRKLSEKIGESVSGIQEIHANDTAQYELADFSQRLGTIFNIRFQIYNKKFFIKFLNNLLAQLTPFFFFSIGGYLVIQGEISLGSLVAVLAAYKDLSPPWKELLTYYQIQADSRIKYDQVISQFEPQGLMDEGKQYSDADEFESFEGEVAAANLSLQDEDQVTIVNGVNFKFPVSDHVAVVGSSGSGKEELMLMLARLIEPTGGKLNTGGSDLAEMPEAVTGRRISFVGQNSYIFSSSLKDNLLYGLKHRPNGLEDDSGSADHAAEESVPEEKKRKKKEKFGKVDLAGASDGTESPSSRRHFLAEAARAGNSVHDIFVDWVDYNSAGVGSTNSVVAAALKSIEIADMAEDVYQYGMRGSLNPAASGEAAGRILKARTALMARLQEPAYADLVEPFDRATYNMNATLAENLIFGNPVGDAFDIEKLAENSYVLEVLKKADLIEDLLSCGHQLTATMIELFADLPPDHELFQRFSFISADELPEYQVLVTHTDKEKLDELGDEDRTRLMSLPFKLIPARHRLGLIDEAMQVKILEARRIFHEDLPEDLQNSVEMFDHEKYNSSATLQDNILFGKVAYGQAQAAEKIGELVAEVVDVQDLRATVMEVGLDYQAGIAGSRLSATQRQKLAIARAVMKRPEVIVLSEATVILEAAAQARILDNVLQEFSAQGVVWSLHRASDAERFAHVLVMKNGRVVENGSFNDVNQDGSAFRELMENE